MLSSLSAMVNDNPPARLKWYFEEPELREYLLPAMIDLQVASVWQP